MSIAKQSTPTSTSKSSSKTSDLINRVAEDHAPAAAALAAIEMSRPDPVATSCRVFSASMHSDRQALGDQVTTFLQKLRAAGGVVVERDVRQSSDETHHCLTIVLWYQVPDGVRVS